MNPRQQQQSTMRAHAWFRWVPDCETDTEVGGSEESVGALRVTGSCGSSTPGGTEMPVMARAKVDLSSSCKTTGETLGAVGRRSDGRRVAAKGNVGLLLLLLLLLLEAERGSTRWRPPSGVYQPIWIIIINISKSSSNYNDYASVSRTCSNPSFLSME